MKKSIKNIITIALMVPTLAFGVSLFMPSMSVFAVDDTSGGLNGGATSAGGDVGGPSCLFGDGCFLSTVINIALYFIGAISVLMIIIGGVRYTMSAGNEKAVGAAKNTILYAVVGLVVALLAFAIVNFVLTKLT